MLFPRVAKAAFFLLVIGLVVVAGCQRQPEPEQKKEALAEPKKVTIDLTGMT